MSALPRPRPRAMLLTLALAGCASGHSPHAADPSPGGSSPLSAAIARANRAAAKDRNLARMELALDALQLGDQQVAFASVSDVFASLQTVFGAGPGAQKARKLWFSETEKEFKGEPYERAMVGYYLGLLYLERHDYGNAQAAFRFGAMQDAFAEEGQYASDFALLYYLEALALMLQDRQGRQPSAAAQTPLRALAQLRPDLSPPDPAKNVLVIVETGKAPRKVTDGLGHAVLRYFRGRGFRENGAALSIDGSTTRLYPIEDIWWQAATRGGRLVDRINHGKLEFRTRMDKVGTALTTASMTVVAVGNGDAATATGAVTAIAGSAALITAANVDASADDRYWNNLPDAVHVLQLALPPGPHDAQITFLAGGEPTDHPPPRTIHFDVAADGLSVVWVRSRLLLSGEP